MKQIANWQRYTLVALSFLTTCIVVLQFHDIEKHWGELGAPLIALAAGGAVAYYANKKLAELQDHRQNLLRIEQLAAESDLGKKSSLVADWTALCIPEGADPSSFYSSTPVVRIVLATVMKYLLHATDSPLIKEGGIPQSQVARTAILNTLKARGLDSSMAEDLLSFACAFEYKIKLQDREVQEKSRVIAKEHIDLFREQIESWRSEQV